MCGRFIVKSDLDAIQRAFEIDDVRMQIKPSYNVAPSQQIGAVIYRDKKRALENMQWGFQPAWAKEKGIRPVINARAETVATNGLFKQAFLSRRCLIVADGFYEWKKTGKVPMFIHLKSDEPFAFAGIYVPGKSGDATCAIITTEPNALMRDIHDRMPVILQPKAYTAWLDPTNQDAFQLQAWLKPFPASQMQAWRVSPQVNKPQNNSPELIAKVQ